jgi:hypothetical protein
MTILIGLEIDSAKTGIKPLIPRSFIDNNEYFLNVISNIKKYGFYYKSKNKQSESQCNLNKLQDIINDIKSKQKTEAINILM